MPYKISSMKSALKSVPGLADVGVLHGDGDGPRTSPRCLVGVRKRFHMTYFTMPNNSSSMKYALKSVLGLADVGVPYGDGYGPRTSPRCLHQRPKIVAWKPPPLYQQADQEWTRIPLDSFLLPSIFGWLITVHSQGQCRKSLLGAFEGRNSKKAAYHVDQREKLKGYHRSKST